MRSSWVMSGFTSSFAEGEPDAAVAASNPALVQDQTAVFKAPGGGWRAP
jgi:hypothetical protein